jgi:hypothetical protein
MQIRMNLAGNRGKDVSQSGYLAGTAWLLSRSFRARRAWLVKCQPQVLAELSSTITQALRSLLSDHRICLMLLCCNAVRLVSPFGFGHRPVAPGAMGHR